MRSLKLGISATVTLLLAGSVCFHPVIAAESAQEQLIHKLVEPRLGGETKIKSVTKTPYSGLYEIQAGNVLFYTDEKAQYLFVGRILDSKTLLDYTKLRQTEINRISFSDLPLDSAMKVIRGNGKRVIAIFEDPNCGYCKKFGQILQGVDNITIYTFLYNILSPDSATKSRNIWCAPNRIKAWDDWMLDGKTPPDAKASCTTPNEKIFALGQKLSVTGTPTIFFADGSRIPGAVDAQALEAKLATVK
jgi:thiol:disulfide interchange protein DsbC